MQTIIQRNRTLEDNGFEPDGKPNHYKKVFKSYTKKDGGVYATIRVSNSAKTFSLEVMSDKGDSDRYLKLTDTLGGQTGYGKINTAIRFLFSMWGIALPEIT